MSSFDTSKSINKPAPLRMCCDICSTSCTCSQCSNSMLDFESFTKFQLDDVKHELSGAKHAPSKKPTDPAIKEGLLQYRFKLSGQFRDPNAVQMVGLEIATGLSDYAIDQISSEAHKIQSEMDLIHSGVPSEHASPILKLVQSQRKQ